jgi:hypothetical protein
MVDQDRDETIEAFHETVNMTAEELEDWLRSEESRSVGQQEDGEESVGHASGRRIVALLRQDDADHTDDDVAHMRKVLGYIRRHRAQPPSGDTRSSRWRYSLMNWGHDPIDADD